MKTTLELDSLWNYNDPSATERRFHQLLEQLPAESAEAAEVLTQVARTQGLQGKFEVAHTTLDQTEQLLRKEWTRARIRYFLERGRLYNSSGHADAARSLFLDAWKLASNAATEESLAIDAAHMMAIVEPPDQKIEWNLQALAMAESATDKKAQQWKASLYNNIGWSYHEQGDFEQALLYFQKALVERSARQSIAEIRIARWCVARALRSLGRIEEAMQMQLQLLAEMESDGSSDGFVNEELGECLLLLNQPIEAAQNFAFAYEQLSQDSWFARQEPQRLERMRMLSQSTHSR